MESMDAGSNADSQGSPEKKNFGNIKPGGVPKEKDSHIDKDGKPHDTIVIGKLPTRIGPKELETLWAPLKGLREQDYHVEYQKGVRGNSKVRGRSGMAFITFADPALATAVKDRYTQMRSTGDATFKRKVNVIFSEAWICERGLGSVFGDETTPKDSTATPTDSPSKEGDGSAKESASSKPEEKKEKLFRGVILQIKGKRMKGEVDDTFFQSHPEETSWYCEDSGGYMITKSNGESVPFDAKLAPTKGTDALAIDNRWRILSSTSAKWTAPPGHVADANAPPNSTLYEYHTGMWTVEWGERKQIHQAARENNSVVKLHGQSVHEEGSNYPSAPPPYRSYGKNSQYSDTSYGHSSSSSKGQGSSKPHVSSSGGYPVGSYSDKGYYSGDPNRYSDKSSGKKGGSKSGKGSPVFGSKYYQPRKGASGNYDQLHDSIMTDPYGYYAAYPHAYGATPEQIAAVQAHQAAVHNAAAAAHHAAAAAHGMPSHAMPYRPPIGHSPIRGAMGGVMGSDYHSKHSGVSGLLSNTSSSGVRYTAGSGVASSSTGRLMTPMYEAGRTDYYPGYTPGYTNYMWPRQQTYPEQTPSALYAANSVYSASSAHSPYSTSYDPAYLEALYSGTSGHVTAGHGTSPRPGTDPHSALSGGNTGRNEDIDAGHFDLPPEEQHAAYPHAGAHAYAVHGSAASQHDPRGSDPPGLRPRGSHSSPSGSRAYFGASRWDNRGGGQSSGSGANSGHASGHSEEDVPMINDANSAPEVFTSRLEDDMVSPTNSADV